MDYDGAFPGIGDEISIELPIKPKALSKPKSMFKFFNDRNELMYVSKNGNFQTLLSKEWWPKVTNIAVEHFWSLDDLEEAIRQTKEKGTKWNRVSVK